MLAIATCRSCHQTFKITDDDYKFYEKIEVPPPTHCPDCRLKRRLSFRNERHLFKRFCDLCKKDIITFFDTNVPFPVYCLKCWWSNSWDPMQYGKNFDFAQPFFPQFKKLLDKVPKAGMLNLSCENCDYNSLIAYSKNTYMSPGSYYVENCYYLRKSQNCHDCIDGNLLDHCELVACSTNCQQCYNCYYLINCKNCYDSKYLSNCLACKNCFMCSGIQNKQYHILNKPHNKEEYEKILTEKEKLSEQERIAEFETFQKTIPKKYQNQINCENSSGDSIQNCKNAHECYDCLNIEDSKFLIECVNIKDSMDLSIHDEKIELCYELCSGGDSNHLLKFAFCSCMCQNASYLYSCFHLTDSFGCDGIHARQSHCILNKKYTKEEYEKMVQKIIEHMKETREYGEFFPIQLSPHPYNLTVAQDYFPLTKEEIFSSGYQFKEEIPHSEKTNQGVKCDTCGKNYRVIAQELALLKKMKIERQNLCHNCRQKELIKMKNPRKLYERHCHKCGITMQTTYNPNQPEMIYCEQCYLKSIY